MDHIERFIMMGDGQNSFNQKPILMKNTLNQWEITIFKWKFSPNMAEQTVQPKQLVIEGEKLTWKSVTS